MLRLVLLWASLARAVTKDSKEEFERIYKAHLWSQAGGGSGQGSTLEYTRHTRTVLYDFILQHDVHSMVDAPCGSFHWMPALLKRLEAHGRFLEYTGYDVVSSIIEDSQKAYANVSKWNFMVSDITNKPLLHCDLIVSRDALQHLSIVQVWSVLRNFKVADPRFLLVGSYPSNTQNVDIETGEYNSINLFAPPFNLFPMQIFSEQTEDTKHLYLYTQSQIRAWSLI